MSQSLPKGKSPAPGQPYSPDALPPVEPPSGAFLVQLFVIPAVIVSLIVLVWLAVTWLARGGDDPRQYFDALKRSGPARFQSAANLAAALADQRHEEFKRDASAAADLAGILQEEIKTASMEEQDVTLRQFLCKALGEFYVDAGVPALLTAATTQRKPVEVHVRRAAIEALAVLAEHLQQQEPPQRLNTPELESTLLTLSTDSDATIRYTTSVTLGVLGGEAQLARLREMLSDDNIDVRYNAALSLARNGDDRSLPMLLQMLEPTQEAALAQEKVSGAREFKRISILSNAMRGVVRFKQKRPEADISELAAAIEHLRDTSEDNRTRLDAETTLMALSELSEKPSVKKTVAP